MLASFSPKCSLHRALRLLVGEGGDAAAVIADRGAQAREPAVAREERDGAAHAEADDADRAGRLELFDRGVGVAHHRVPVGLGDEGARLLDLGRRVAGLEILLRAVEQRRRHRGIAIAGEVVADLADVLVDAENLLDDDDAALRRAGRIGPIGAELETCRMRRA